MWVEIFWHSKIFCDLTLKTKVVPVPLLTRRNIFSTPLYGPLFQPAPVIIVDSGQQLWLRVEWNILSQQTVSKYFVTSLWMPKMFLAASSQGETYFAPPLWPTISTCPSYHCWQWSTIMAEGGVKYFDTANCVKKNCNLTLNAKNVPGHLLTRRNIFCTPFMAHYFILPQLSLLIDPLVIQRILYWDECLTL